MPEIIRTELISRHHDNLLAGYFGIKKTRELIVQKYYWLTFKANIESYVKGCDVFFVSKVVKHKLYGNLQFFLIPTH